MSKTSAPVVEVYQTENQKTKSGKPYRWRWQILDTDGERLGKGQHSFATEDKALHDIELHAVIPTDAILRRPGHPDRKMAAAA